MPLPSSVKTVNGVDCGKPGELAYEPLGRNGICCSKEKSIFDFNNKKAWICPTSPSQVPKKKLPWGGENEIQQTEAQPASEPKSASEPTSVAKKNTQEKPEPCVQIGQRIYSNNKFGERCCKGSTPEFNGNLVAYFCLPSADPSELKIYGKGDPVQLVNINMRWDVEWVQNQGKNFINNFKIMYGKHMNFFLCQECNDLGRVLVESKMADFQFSKTNSIANLGIAYDARFLKQDDGFLLVGRDGFD
eukprot:Pgem_evm1s5630